MLRFIFSILILYIFTQCSENKDIKVIKILYMSEHATTHATVGCNNIYMYKTEKMKIEDTKILVKASKCLEVIKNENDNCSEENVDVRIACLIVYNKNQTSDTLCMGAHYGAILNGKTICDNNDLFNIIRNMVYNNSE